MKCERYAVWWVPQRDSRLARFGAEWTGWCPEKGSLHRGGELSSFAEAHANLPAGFRLGGLHAPFGSAFRLAEGRSPWALERALAELAARTPPILLPSLRLERRKNRLRLGFGQPPLALAQLIEAVAETVRPLRMTSPLAEMARPEASVNDEPVLKDASERGKAALRFGFWLTGSSSTSASVSAELEPILAPILASPPVLSDLALICDPGGNRPWRVLERFELQGGPETGLQPTPSGMDCFGPRLFTSFETVASALN